MAFGLGSNIGRRSFVGAGAIGVAALAVVCIGASLIFSDRDLARSASSPQEAAPVAQAAAPAPDRNVRRTFLTDIGAQERNWPRLKPKNRDQAIPLEFPVPVGVKFKVPATSAGIAHEDDYSGTQSDPFTSYLQDRRMARTEEAYETAVLTRGIEVEQLLLSIGAREEDIAAILEAASAQTDPNALEPGVAIEYAFERVFIPASIESQDANGSDSSISFLTEQRVLSRLRFRPADRKVLTAWRQSDGSYTAQLETLNVEQRLAAVAGVIRHSLFASADKADMPPEIMSKFANLFLYDIDFARDIHVGDRFEAVYEVFYDEDGTYVGSGEIVFAAMSWRGGRDSRAYYRFDAPGFEETPFFDAAGESATRMLMKTPIEGAKVTSGFGKRHHPILGYSKQHKGVDFGATRGTPIMAAGDGLIERAAPTGTFGNYIKVVHAHGYATAYAHLDGFASGITKGARVRQGQIIGYVGSTGRSTGPHLHYEVTHHGAIQNPMRLKVANGRALDQSNRSDFEDVRRRLDGVRLHPLTVAMATSE